MSGQGFSSRDLDNLLVGLDERDLADLIEGQIDADRRLDLETMLVKRPELRRLVDSMRADRAALRAMPDEFCHVDLAAGVRDVLEREALLGESADTGENAPPPITITPRRAPRQFALAAGLLLLVGGGVFLAWPLLTNSPGNTRPTPGPIALSESKPKESDTRKPAPSDAAPGPDSSGSLAIESSKSPGVPVVVPDAARDTGALIAANPSSADPIESPLDADELLGPMIPADIALARAIEAPIDEARAAELALAGRLLVRVQGASAAYVLSSSADRGALGAFRVDRVEPGALASPVLAQVFEGATTPEQIVWASDHAMPVYDRDVVGPEGYVVEFAATAQGLAALREALGGRVTFEELPEDAGLRARVDPDAVLWWTLPPSSWAPRVAAPIILEH